MDITVVFPGQGSQYVGMGKEFAKTELFHRISFVLGPDLQRIMLEGPSEELKLTHNTQPAIVAHSLMLFDKLKKILLAKKLYPQRVLGHSVGEYSALAAAEVMSFEECIRAVYFRGKFMQEASPPGVGAMYAILKQEETLITQACLLASNKQEIVTPANFNDPTQIVISGHKEACMRAIEIMEKKSQGRVKAIELPVSAPFHSPLMRPVEKKMENILNEIQFKNLKINYVANIDAQEYSLETSPLVLKENLIKQICGSVLWTQSIQKLPSSSVLIECGPGKILAGLIKKINPPLKVISLDSEPGWSEVEAL